METKVQFNKIFAPANHSTCRYVVMKGSAGSGKSVDAAQQYILRLLDQRGRNLLALRKSEVTNRDSTFAELQAAIYRMQLGEYFKIINNPLEISCRNGNKIIFRGMNDAKQREKIKSITFATGDLTDIWLEEATEFSKEDVDILDDRLRGILPSGLFYQMRMTFNPVSATHWIKERYFDAVDPDVFTHHSTYLDNRFCDEAYHRRMERRKREDPDGYRIYGLGEWGTLSGQILKNWKVDDISQDFSHYDAVYLGQDFGYNHANVILTLGFKDGDIYILDEIYVREMDPNDIIKLANKKGLSKSTAMYCDSASPERVQMWYAAGYSAYSVVKEKGSVNAQIDYLKGVDTPRHIYVHPSCVNTKKELQHWRWKYDDRLGKYIDQPLEVEDDAMAALRYGVEPMRKPRKLETIGGLIV